MVRRIPLTATIVIALAPALRPASAKPIDLAPRFESGTTTHYISRSNVRLRIQVELADVDEKVEVRTEAGMSLSVLDVDSNGHARLAWILRFVNISTDAAIPGLDNKLDYDSRRPGSTPSPLSGLFMPLIDKPVHLTVDALGKVQRFEQLPAGDPLNPLTALRDGIFSRQAFEQLPLFITANAPQPARFRSTWTASAAIELPLSAGSLQIQEEFQFERTSPRRSLARIRMKGVITLASPNARVGAGIAALNPQATLNVEDGKVTGVYQWNYAVGRIDNAETAIDLQTTLSSVLGPMKLTQKTSTALQLVKPADVGMSLEKEPNER